MAQVTLLTKEQAEVPRPRSPGGGKKRIGHRPSKTYHGRPAVTEHEQRQLLKTRPKGHAAAYALHIEPWIPVKDHHSVASVVADLKGTFGHHIHISTNPKSTGIAMAFYSGRWHRIMMLEEKVHVRRLRPAWGLARPGFMPCDCCFFRTDSRELRPVAVGKSNATTQEFHVCLHCLNEGVLGRTSAAGYIVKRID